MKRVTSSLYAALTAVVAGLVAGLAIPRSAEAAETWTLACRKGRTSHLRHWRDKRPPIISGRAVDGVVCIDVLSPPKTPMEVCEKASTRLSSPMFHDVHLFADLFGDKVPKDVKGAQACAHVFKPVRLECPAGLELRPGVAFAPPSCGRTPR